MKLRTASIFRKSLSYLLDLVYPKRCTLCDCTVEPTDGLICPVCERELEYVSEPFCMKCGKKLSDEEREYCPDCEKKKHVYDAGRSLFPYRDDVIKSIYRLKYSGRQGYAQFYGDRMARVFGGVIRDWGVDVIVPVPLHKSRLRERGYNQAALIARALGAGCGIPVAGDCVIRVRKTKPLKLLNAAARQDNLKNAFKIGRIDVKLKTVLLVDDIYTTGSTIDEVCRVLRQAGAYRIYFLTAAAGC